MGYRTIIARYVAEWGIAQTCLCETKKSTKGGVSRHFWGVLTSFEKYRAIWGIAAIVSQDCMCDMGSLRDCKGGQKKPQFRGPRIQNSCPQKRGVKFSPFFSSKGGVIFGVKFSRCYVFQGLGVRIKNSVDFGPEKNF